MRNPIAPTHSQRIGDRGYHTPPAPQNHRPPAGQNLTAPSRETTAVRDDLALVDVARPIMAGAPEDPRGALALTSAVDGARLVVPADLIHRVRPLGRGAALDVQGIPEPVVVTESAADINARRMVALEAVVDVARRIA